MTSILCIDHDRDVRRGMAGMLRRLGYRVFESPDCVDGLDAARRVLPDAIVCSLEAPRMDGYAFLGALRRDHRRLAAVPVILLVASQDHEDAELGRDLGVDDYLMKPVDPELLRSCLAASLTRTSGSRPGRAVRTA